jgi:hypothetical protein
MTAGSEAGYSVAYWAEAARCEAGVRQFAVRLAAPSEAAFRDALGRLRWEAGVETLWAAWDAGEGEARVECCGDLDELLAALGGVVAAGDVVAVYRG